MKNIPDYLKVLMMFVLIIMISCSGDPGRKAAEELGWDVGFQAYTFKEFTFAEALMKGDSAGLKSVEAYPGQQIGAGIEGTTDYSMDQETRQKVKDLLDEKGIKLNAYGVTVAEDTAGWKQLFEFAQEMGIGVITSEPGMGDMALVDQLSNEYGIKVAIHNHPAPSPYWHPDSVLMAMEGRSKNIGSCADIGHWIRSGLDPVECLKKLEGRIVILHFKDLNEKTLEAYDVPWGTGVADVPSILKELKRQGFTGLFDIEYEHNWLNSVPEVKQCADNFYKMVAEI